MALLPKINMLTSNLVTVVQKIISSLTFSLGLECYSYLKTGSDTRGQWADIMDGIQVFHVCNQTCNLS